MSAIEIIRALLRRALPTAVQAAISAAFWAAIRASARAAVPAAVLAGSALLAVLCGPCSSEAQEQAPRDMSGGGAGIARGTTSSEMPGVRVDALPVPITRTTLDLEAIARGYAAQAQAQMNERDSPRAGKAPGLLIFVSLSMPRPTLQRLVAQAAQARAAVVMRGFVDGSLRRTAEVLQPLIGVSQLAVQIDPQAFDRFNVQRVPTFVLVRDGARPQSCASGTCAPASDFVRVAGDVSLGYALAHVSQTQPAFRRDAQVFLRRLAPDGTSGATAPGMEDADVGAGHALGRQSRKH